jgi:hypothetical protein
MHASDRIDIWRKFRFLSETMDEIDDWVDVGHGDSRPRDLAGVPDLLGSLLARKRVSIETVELAREREGPREPG